MKFLILITTPKEELLMIFFFKRRFSSFIYQETNVYNNRFIWSFKKGLDAMLESDRIKEFIFKFEHDLWEY